MDPQQVYIKFYCAMMEVFQKVKEQFDPKIKMEYYKQLLNSLRGYISQLRLVFLRENFKYQSQDPDRIYLEVLPFKNKFLFGKYVSEINDKQKLLRIVLALIIINQIIKKINTEISHIRPTIICNQLNSANQNLSAKLGLCSIDLLSEEFQDGSDIIKICQTFLKNHTKFSSKKEEYNQFCLNIFENVIKGSEIIEIYK